MNCQCAEVIYVFSVSGAPVQCGYCNLPVEPEKVPFNLRSAPTTRPQLRVIKGGKED